MADTLKTTILIQYLKESPPSTQILNSNTIVISPSTEVSGIKTLDIQENNFIIASNAKYVYLYSDKEFKVTMNTTDLFDTKVFMYQGSEATFKVSNPSSSSTVSIYFTYSN